MIFYKLEFFSSNHNDGFVNLLWPIFYIDTLNEANNIIMKQKNSPDYIGHILCEVKVIDEYRLNK